MPVHYAGVAVRDGIDHRDRSPAPAAGHRGRCPGADGALQGAGARKLRAARTLSFHETKNIVSGEGGALLINDLELAERAEIIREKGTNRSQFFRGAVDKYTWVDIGSSYLPGELIAAFLWAQLEEATPITTQRLMLWERYHEAFAELEAQDRIRRPIVPDDCENNAHMYYLLCPTWRRAPASSRTLREKGVQTVFHYVPLHSAPAGQKYGRASGSMHNTDSIGDRLVRLAALVRPWQGSTARYRRRIRRGKRDHAGSFCGRLTDAIPRWLSQQSGRLSRLAAGILLCLFTLFATVTLAAMDRRIDRLCAGCRSKADSTSRSHSGQPAAGGPSWESIGARNTNTRIATVWLAEGLHRSVGIPY